MDRIGDEHPAGIGQGFDPSGDVDAVSVDVVALDDHIAEIDADAQFDAVVRLSIRVPLGHRLLHRDPAADRIDDARKLHQHAVAGGLDDPAVMLGDFRIEEFPAQRFETFECAFLVRPHQPRIAGHIGGEDRGETPASGSLPLARRQAQPGQEKLAVLGVAVRQNGRHDLRGDRAQPCDDRARFVEPPHMGIACGENSGTGRDSRDGLELTGAGSTPLRQTDV